MKTRKSPECLGFDENVVLAVKNCFYEEDMRLILIKLTSERISYHDRRCTGILSNKNETSSKVSQFCTDWFNALGSQDKDAKDEESQIQEEMSSQVEEEDSVDNLDQRMGEHDKENTESPALTDSSAKFSCEFCSKKFKLKASLDKHQFRHHRKQKLLQKFSRNGEFNCHFCGLAFTKKPSMQRHIQRNHPRDSKELATQQKEDVVVEAGSVNCDLPGCRSYHSNQREYKTHMRTAHNLPKKGRRSKEPIDLDLAISLGLDETMTDVPYEQAEECSYCQTTLESRVKMYWHVKRSHLQTQKPCPLCGMLVKKLSDHMKRQHSESKDERKFVCEFCGDSFKGSSGYQFHLAGHTGEKKYSCRTCGKHYRTSSESYNCERGHQGIYKWRCAQCPFKSHQRNKYIRHLRIHTKSQPYMCPLCEHRTARKDYLQKHIQKSHCNSSVSVTLDHIEKMYPNMYNIDEKIDIKAPISYTKLKMPLPVATNRVGEPQEAEVLDSGHLQGHHALVPSGTKNSLSGVTMKSKRLEDEGVNLQQSAGRMMFLQSAEGEVGELSTLVVDHATDTDPGLQVVQSGAIDLHKAAVVDPQHKLGQHEKRTHPPPPSDYVPKNVVIEFFPRYSHQRSVSAEHQRLSDHGLRPQEQPHAVHGGGADQLPQGGLEPAVRYFEHAQHRPEQLQQLRAAVPVYDRPRIQEEQVPRELYQRMEGDQQREQILGRSVHRDHGRLNDVEKVQIQENTELVQNVIYLKREDAVQISYIPLHRTEGDSYMQMRDITYDKSSSGSQDQP